MENGFEVLEQKVRRAAQLVKELRKESSGLQQDLNKAKGRLKDAEKRLAALEKEQTGSSAQAEELETLQGAHDQLVEEREEIRTRIAKLVEVLDGLE